MLKKIALIVALAAIVVLFFVLELDTYLTIEHAKTHVADFKSLIHEHQLLSIAIFFMTYVIVAALSLPGAAIMSLAAGALFGLPLGVVIVSFSSTMGATAAFLVSRYIFRDFVRNHFGDKWVRMDEGINKQGAFYLFTLRMIPIVPFELINLAMGVTKIKTWTFYWVSQLGMIAGTIVYVNAGTQLAEIDSLANILSPNLILSFVLLAIFPWLTKSIMNLFTRRRLYKAYQKPKQFDFNLIVIGAGAGGLVSSYIAAAVKSKVALIESQKMGGDCLNYGCVPSKAIIKSAKIAHQMRHADQYGLEVSDTPISFKKVMQRVIEIIQKIAPNDSVERYQALGVEVIQGYATIQDPWTVIVTLENGETQTLTTKNIIIATGGHPVIPDIPGIESSGYLTSETVWQHFSTRSTAPKRLLILGGGAMGCELAQAFSRLGSEVTQIVRSAHLMDREDIDVAQYVQKNFEQNGIQVLTEHRALRFESDQTQRYLIVEHNGQEKALPYDEIIIATGRKPRLEGFGLEKLGIQTQQVMETNVYLQTIFPNIYAVGDVVGSYQFTHVAAHQAWYATVNALFGGIKKFKVDYRLIPWVTFTDPEVARVGLSEAQAKAKSIEYEITRIPCSHWDRAVTDSAEQGFIKILTAKNKDKILGVTIVSEQAEAILPEFVLAMKYNLGLNKLLRTIHAYPTWAEGAKYAAGAWKQAHQPTHLLKWLERYHTWRRR